MFNFSFFSQTICQVMLESDVRMIHPKIILDEEL